MNEGNNLEKSFEEITTALKLAKDNNMFLLKVRALVTWRKLKRTAGDVVDKSLDVLLHRTPKHKP